MGSDAVMSKPDDAAVTEKPPMAHAPAVNKADKESARIKLAPTRPIQTEKFGKLGLRPNSILQSGRLGLRGGFLST